VGVVLADADDLGQVGRAANGHRAANAAWWPLVEWVLGDLGRDACRHRPFRAPPAPLRPVGNPSETPSSTYAAGAGRSGPVAQRATSMVCHSRLEAWGPVCAVMYTVASRPEASRAETFATPSRSPSW